MNEIIVSITELLLHVMNLKDLRESHFHSASIIHLITQ